MKYFLKVLLNINVMLIISLCNAQTKKPIIKTLEVTKTVFSIADSTLLSKTKEVTEYNKYGDVTSEKEFMNNRCMLKEVYNYNSKKELIEIIEYDTMHDTISVAGKYNYKYLNNKVIEYSYTNKLIAINPKNQHWSDENNFQHCYEYESESNKKIKYTKNSNADVISKKTTTYRLSQKISDTILANGKLSKIILYNKSGKPIFIKEQSEKRGTLGNSDYIMETKTYTYNENGNPRELTHHLLFEDGDDLLFFNYYRYNKNNHCTKVTSLDKNLDITGEMVYTYNKHGDWVVLEQKTKDKIITKKAIITYY